MGDRGLEDWTLLGHSFGGFVAMQHLVDFPGSASRLILSCTDADEEPAPGVSDELDFSGMPPEVEAAFERLVRPFGLIEMARTGEIAISRGRGET